MTWLLPFPWMSAGLFVLWLLLNQSLSPGHMLLGTIAGLVGGWAFAALEPLKAHPRRIAAFLRLAGVAFADIVRSNIAVARIVLGLRRSDYSSGYVEIPLELRDPYGLAMLACIITSTPGTLWVDFNSANRILTIHVLDLAENDDWVGTIKGRYERQLLDIFP